MRKYALNLAEDGRILSATFETYAAPDMALSDTLPEGDISEYRYENGEFVHDPLPVEPVESEPTTEEVLLELAADHEARLCEIELGVN